MRVSIVSKKSSFQTHKLLDAAQECGIDAEVVDVATLEQVKNLGDIVIWRSSSLGKGAQRHMALEMINQDRILMNESLVFFPRVTDKPFQQEFVHAKTRSINTIPSFLFSSVSEMQGALENKTLEFPFIQKPRLGSKGEGVKLVRSLDDIDLERIEESVFQNFIRNTGDYRVFVVGGKVLGAIHRKAKPGNFLNNVSQGGIARNVDDESVLSSLRFIAGTIASIFRLTVCGVDIIFDETKRRYLFLEVNTVPQWEGFQKTTGIDVAREIILHAKTMHERKSKPSAETVLQEYTSHINCLWDKKFHFLSRMYLWTREEQYKGQLEILNKERVGDTKENRENAISLLLTSQKTRGEGMVAKQKRKYYFGIYPQLESFVSVLFKGLFAETLYNIDMRYAIREHVNDYQFLELEKSLSEDVDAIQILSTHAVNYFYLLDFYLKKEQDTRAETLFHIGKSFVSRKTDNESLALQFYFFTHCVLGASHFYDRLVAGKTLEIYREMMRNLDILLDSRYKEVSLDNKFEFLVCCKLCSYVSRHKDAIHAEAERSFSPIGNFLVDTHNKHATETLKRDFATSEHRNVLFLLSHLPYHTNTNTKTGAEIGNYL